MPICPPYLFFSATPIIKLPLFSLMLEILTIELLQEKLMLWIMQNQHRLIPQNGLTLQKLFMQYFCWHCIIRHSSAVFVIFCILQNYLEVLLNHRWSCDTLWIPNSYQSLMASIYIVHLSFQVVQVLHSWRLKSDSYCSDINIVSMASNLLIKDSVPVSHSTGQGHIGYWSFTAIVTGNFSQPPRIICSKVMGFVKIYRK